MWNVSLIRDINLELEGSQIINDDDTDPNTAQ